VEARNIEKKNIKIDKNAIPNSAITLINDIMTKGSYEAYLVGGCVRDLLLGETPHDYDICSNATPSQIISLLKTLRYKYHTVGIEFGTVTAIMQDGNEYEITTYRGESTYTDGRHPDSVNFVSTIQKDLVRRDFTINAIAYNPVTDNLIDLFGGRRDINKGVIRSIQKPDISFKDDALRIMRALRFAIKFGYVIDMTTSLAINRNVDLLNNISKERITEEYKKIFSYNKPVLQVFSQYRKVIATTIPEIVPCFDFKQNNKYHKHDVYKHTLHVVDKCNTNKFEIKMAALLHDIGKPSTCTLGDDGYCHFYGHPEVSYEISQKLLKERFRLTTEQYELILNLIRYHDITIATTRKSVKRALNKHGLDFLKDWFILKKADADDHVYPDNNWKYMVDIPKIKEIIQEILDENACFKLKDLKINGNDIMKLLNIKPCEHIGIILNTLLNEVIDEDIINDPNVLKTRASEIYKEIS